MPAIPVHHTDTVDTPWDANENRTNLKLDQDEAYYRKAFAWQDPEADPTTKQAWKFIHHMVDADGNIGAANVRACQTGIAVLNGAMNGADIPDADRQGVYRHLAAHLTDAGVEPAELNSARMEVERRAFTLELRAAPDKPRQIVGHAAVFDTITDLGWFKERVARGAFAESIQRDDIRALFNHDPNYVLGRNTAGTLRLSEDDKGLYFEIDLPDTQFARDLYTSIQRGDINQCSFGFVTLDEGWETVDGEIVRALRKVQLWDVSPVTYPAYPTTDASVRAQIQRIWSQHGASREDIEDKPKAEQDRQGAEPRQVPLDVLRRRLELAIKD